MAAPHKTLIIATGQLVYDVAVVGGGLFGSAVAKYAAEDGVSVVMVGPSEEAKLTVEIFGAWHDEGRIAELADSDGVWHVMGEYQCDQIQRQFRHFGKI